MRPMTAKVIMVAVLAVIGLGIAALVWVHSYQPLAFGGGSVYPTISSRYRDGSFRQNNARFRQGRPFKVGISVVNNGRFTVRVLGITGEYDHSFAELPLSHRRLIVSGPLPKSSAQWVRPYRSFRPFDLPPGQVMFL